jgi:hypothetical protein
MNHSINLRNKPVQSVEQHQPKFVIPYPSSVIRYLDDDDLELKEQDDRRQLLLLPPQEHNKQMLAYQTLVKEKTAAAAAASAKSFQATAQHEHVVLVGSPAASTRNNASSQDNTSNVKSNNNTTMEQDKVKSSEKADPDTSLPREYGDVADSANDKKEPDRKSTMVSKDSKKRPVIFTVAPTKTSSTKSLLSPRVKAPNTQVAKKRFVKTVIT